MDTKQVPFGIKLTIFLKQALRKGWIQFGLFLAMFLVNITLLLTYFTTRNSINLSIQSIYLTSIKLTTSFPMAVVFFTIVKILMWITLFIFVVYLTALILTKRTIKSLKYWVWTSLFAIGLGFTYLSMTSTIYKNLNLYNQALSCKQQTQNLSDACKVLLENNSTLIAFSKFAGELSAKIVPIVTVMVLLFMSSFITFFLLIRGKQRITYRFVKGDVVDVTTTN